MPSAKQVTEIAASAPQAVQTPPPDLTSVRTLIKSPAKLARHLGMSLSGVSRWVKVNRIPGTQIVAVANYYDVELRDLLHLTGSDVANDTRRNIKPRETLPLLLEVYRGTRMFDGVISELGISAISAKLILTHWGDELPTLYTTLSQLDEKRISIETAMQRLGVTRYSLFNIRAKYGFAPRAKPGYVSVKERKAQKALEDEKDTQRHKEGLLQCLAGKLTPREATEAMGVASRTFWKQFEAISSVKYRELSKWPGSFRSAFAVETERGMEHFTVKWLAFAQKHALFLKRVSPRPATLRKFPSTPDRWKTESIKRMMVAVLLGEAPIDEVAASRGADVDILKNLFTSDLRNLDLTFDQAQELPLEHQVALSELILATLDRKRRFVSKADGAVASESASESKEVSE